MSQPQSDPMRGVIEFFPQRGTTSLTVKLKHPLTIIGREKADVIIDDTEVSASHCQIQDIEGTYFIFDMNSTNGTYLNDNKVVKAPLTPQDVIRIGKTKLRFLLVDAHKASSIPLFDKYQVRRKAGQRTMLETMLAENRRTYLLKIKATYPDNSSEMLSLDHEETWLGRDSVIGNFNSDPTISARHLLIKINSSGEVFVKDHNSHIGTFVNDKKINGMHKVTVNDHIRIGATILQLQDNHDQNKPRS